MGPEDSLVGLFASPATTLVFDDGSVCPASRLADEASRIAGYLAAHGIGPGDRVAVRMRNGPDYVRLLLGCAARGAVVVSVNTRSRDVEATELAVASHRRPPARALIASCVRHNSRRVRRGRSRGGHGDGHPASPPGPGHR